MSSPRCRDTERDRGQAVAEFALTLPLVLLAVSLVAEVGSITIDQIRLVHLCRNAARVASVSLAPETAAREFMARSGADDINTVVAYTDSVVTVSLTRLHRTELPLIGSLLPDVSLHEELSMYAE